MKFLRTVVTFLCAIVLLLSVSDILLAQHQHNQEHSQEISPKQQWLDLQQQPAGSSLTLAELEQMAAEKNPTIAQAEAAIIAAQGRRRQAGLWPNPIIGYRGDEFAFRAFDDKSEHFFTVEQNIPLGGKLSKSRRIFEQEISQAETNATAQKQRVNNTVRLLYYEALAAQQRVAIRSKLAQITRDAVKTTGELLNVGQADRPDYSEIEIEAQQVEQELVDAQNDQNQVWELMVLTAGMPDLTPRPLAGDLESDIPQLDQQIYLTTLLRESPEIKIARAKVERAQAALVRARADRIPDLFIRGAIGYSNELLETRTPSNLRATGTEASIEVGITLPIFNRNQGGVTAAQAELEIAKREVERLELNLRIRTAQVFRDYNNAKSMVERYRKVVLPRGDEAYRLYLARFRQMSASYPQVLISQRNLFQLKEQYLDALLQLRQAAIKIEGQLLTGGLNAPTNESGGEENHKDTKNTKAWNGMRSLVGE